MVQLNNIKCICQRRSSVRNRNEEINRFASVNIRHPMDADHLQSIQQSEFRLFCEQFLSSESLSFEKTGSTSDGKSNANIIVIKRRKQHIVTRFLRSNEQKRSNKIHKRIITTNIECIGIIKCTTTTPKGIQTLLFVGRAHLNCV